MQPPPEKLGSFYLGAEYDLDASELLDVPVGDGRPGPAWKALSESLGRDLRGNTARRTPVAGT